jgi:hypothetical protein
MFKQLRVVTVLFAAIAVVFVAIIVRELTAPSRRLPTVRPQSATTTATPAPSPTPSAPPPAGAGGYAVIASRNLFSPTRTEAPPAPPPAPVVNLPKPNLYGVVLQDGTPIAYLEDPTTKRVARYRVGDAVAGGTLKTISSDSVILSRPDGQIAVRLHDPTRPRPVPPAATPTPGAPTPGAPTPAVQRPTTPFPEGFVPPTAIPSRRPLPPGVLGRVPTQPTDASKPR